MKRLSLLGVVTLMVACGGAGGRRVASSDPFCQQVLPAGAAFMAEAHADNPVLADDRYGGTVVVGTIGEIHFDGQDVRALDREGLCALRRRAQFVFQDPFGSLNPRMSAGAMLEEALTVHNLGGPNHRDRAVEILEKVGVRAEHIDRYPHEFS